MLEIQLVDIRRKIAGRAAAERGMSRLSPTTPAIPGGIYSPLHFRERTRRPRRTGALGGRRPYDGRTV
jgi:hypothetical protein